MPARREHRGRPVGCRSRSGGGPGPGNEAALRIEEAHDDLSRWAAKEGATYLHLVSDVSRIAGVVDITPQAGWGVPGTSLVIDGPESVERLRPRTVVVANPACLGEIEAYWPAVVRPPWV